MAKNELEIYEDSELADILFDRNSCDSFYQFLKEIWCAENLSAWIDIQNYKMLAVDGSPQLVNYARIIYDKYFAENSPQEVNVSSESKKKLCNRLQNPERRAFDNIEEEIFRLMELDSFPKYQESEAYKKIKHDETKKTFLFPRKKSGELKKSKSIGEDINKIFFSRQKSTQI